MLGQGPIWKEDGTSVYSGAQMYANLYGDKDSDIRYREGVTPVSMKEFQPYAVHISDDAKEIDGRSYQAWIVSALLNPLRFIGDPWYLEGHKTPQIVQYSDRRQAIVQFVQNLFSQSSSDLKRWQIM